MGTQYLFLASSVVTSGGHLVLLAHNPSCFSKLSVQVSTAGVDKAHQYMLQQTRQLVAEANRRGDIKAEVSSMQPCPPPPPFPLPEAQMLKPVLCQTYAHLCSC